MGTPSGTVFLFFDKAVLDSVLTGLWVNSSLNGGLEVWLEFPLGFGLLEPGCAFHTSGRMLDSFIACCTQPTVHGKQPFRLASFEREGVT